jgi:hypothetical protein
MPATEQTWRNLKVLHVVFGVVAILLLLATVLMLAIDHDRPWKKYQREFRALETWSAAARIDEQESRSFAEQSTTLEAAVAEARRASLDPALAEAFIAQVRSVPADAAAADRAKLDSDQIRHVLSYTAQQTGGLSTYMRDLDHIEKAFDFGGMAARNGMSATTFSLPSTEASDSPALSLMPFKSFR